MSPRKNGSRILTHIPKVNIIKTKVAFLSTFPPRECGIAKYTKDLVDSLSKLDVTGTHTVIAINDKGSNYLYQPLVKFQIHHKNTEDYSKAAEYVNDSDINLINLQHEFGLYGGAWGENIIPFLEMLEKSVVTTIHTLLLNPEPVARSVLEEILRLSDYVSVPAMVGIDILKKYYGTPADKIRYIPHGCPDVPFIRSEVCKRPLGLENRIVLSTFGLLSRGKGVEYAIEALPTLIDDYPQILYLVIGVTHPGVRKYEGEAYRKELIDLVYSLGLERNVGFVNHFLGENELIRYLQATDVYLIPYPNKEQISSGTLTYALGAGKAIITTPFLHAQEALSQECAMRCEFKDSASITRGIKKLIKNVRMRRTLEKRAYYYSRGMTWPNVAAKYIRLFHEALRSRPHKKLTPLQIAEV